MSHTSRVAHGRNGTVVPALVVAVALAAMTSLARVSLGVGPASASTVAASYACRASTPVGPLAYSGTANFTGTTPTTVAPGTAVSMTGFQATMTVPGSLLDELYGDGLRSISGRVTVFDIVATDAASGVIDAARKPVSLGHVKLMPSDNPTLQGKIPAKPAKIKGWVASNAGTMTFSPGDATIDLKSNLGSLSVPCAPVAPVPAISSTTVS